MSDAEYKSQKFLLGSNKWHGDGTIYPKGYMHLKSFYLDGNVPTWVYKLDDLKIEKKFIRNMKKTAFM